MFGRELSIEEEKRLEGLKTIIPVSKNWQYRSFLNVFESLLLADLSKEQIDQMEN